MTAETRSQKQGREAKTYCTLGNVTYPTMTLLDFAHKWPGSTSAVVINGKSFAGVGDRAPGGLETRFPSEQLAATLSLLTFCISDVLHADMTQSSYATYCMCLCVSLCVRLTGSVVCCDPFPPFHCLLLLVE